MTRVPRVRLQSARAALPLQVALPVQGPRREAGPLGEGPPPPQGQGQGQGQPIGRQAQHQGRRTQVRRGVGRMSEGAGTGDASVARVAKCSAMQSVLETGKHFSVRPCGTKCRRGYDGVRCFGSLRVSIGWLRCVEARRSCSCDQRDCRVSEAETVGDVARRASLIE